MCAKIIFFRSSGFTHAPSLPLPLSLLLLAFFNPRVLRAHGGSCYTFGALAILEGCHPGKNPDVCSESRSVPIAAIRLPPGSTAVTHGTGPTP